MEEKPGLRVVRGPDWKWSDQDGGLGGVGTLASITKVGGEEGFAVVVQWDAGNRCNYRCGLDGKYDLRVFDSVQIGVKHPNIMCDTCQTKTHISGIRWKCSKCFDFDLCTICYYAGKHNMDHEFYRIDHPDSPRKQVPCRLGAKKLMAKGFFSDAEVIRGHDWIWGNQDGGEGKSGRLQSITDQDIDCLRCIAVVEWRESKTRQNYRAGYHGMVDLKCKELANGGYFFPEHLPILGEVEKGGSRPSGPSHGMTVGSKVRVALDVDVFKQMQAGHGGWNDQMAETLGDVGTVSAVMDSGDVRVRYGNNHTWTINPAVLIKAETVQQGDVVRVKNDIALVHTLQEDHGGWVDDMVLSLGQVGRVIRVFPTGDVKVKVNGKTWTFNPQCLEPAPGEAPPEVEDGDLDEDDLDLQLKLLSLVDDPGVVVAAAAHGDVPTLKQFLASHPGSVNTKAGGKTALHCASVSGNIDMVRAILEYKPDLEITDEDGDGALHLSAYSDEDQIATMLLDAGAKVNSHNLKDVTPLMIAAVKGHVSVLRVLVAHKDIRLADQDSDGDTALHCAVLAQKYESMSILLEAGADPTLLNFRLFTPIHESAKMGFLPAMELFCRKFPQHVNIKKEDGFTPLHLSAFNDHLDTLTSLLETVECDMDAVTGDGRTSLQLAVDRGHLRIVERLVGYGCKLDVKDFNGNTALHIALNKSSSISSAVSDETPQMKKVLDVLKLSSEHPDFLRAVVASFLVREGASIYQKNKRDHTPLQALDSEVSTAITAFFGSSSKFHGTLRVPVLPAGLQTSQSLHHSITMNPRRDMEVGVRKVMSAPTSLKGPVDFTDAPSSSKVTTDGSDEEQEICFMCDTNPINTKFEPCGHSVMCEEDAKRAKRCPTCKKRVTGVVLLRQVCTMCSVDEATVTVMPCKHKFCPGCAIRMRLCFECKVHITLKEGLPPEPPPAEVSPSNSQYCSICLTEPKNTALICGHQLCWECSQKVDNCPVCRRHVTHRIRLFQ